MTFDVLVEEIEWLRDGGMSPALICEALKCHPETLERRLDRGGRHDLARFISSETRVRRVS
jgi:IS30 family transposase